MSASRHKFTVNEHYGWHPGARQLGEVKISRQEQNQLKEYLLGQLSEQDEERIEQHLLSDDGFFEELELIENEIIDQYVHDSLSLQDRAQFERHLLRSCQQQGKLAFARALDAESSANADKKEVVIPIRSPAHRIGLLSARYLKIAAVLLITAGLGITFWILLRRQSDVDRGMLALNQAYKNQRLVESRVSELDYAPIKQTRGENSSTVDSLAHDRAERLLLDAVHDRDDAASHHALGRLYLADRTFDKAKGQFEQALKLNPNSAQLHNDLGATLLELGKAERANDNGKGLQYFAQSLEQINHALELNNSLLEALFNRALVLQQMLLLPQAEEAWRRYLERDSGSRWANEARRNLQTLEEQHKKASQKKSDLHDTFLSSYSIRDRESAWVAIAQSRSRMGNQITERLVREYLDLDLKKEHGEATTRLLMLTFAGEVETQRVGDRYTSDLAAYYSRTNQTQRQQLAHARSLAEAATERYNKSEFEDAVSLFNEAWRGFKSSGDTCEALFIESWIGFSELRLPGKESQQTFDRLTGIFEKKSYKSLEAQSLHALSDANTDQNELSKVLKYAERALKLSEAIQDDSTRLRCLQQFVSMNLKFGNYLESLRYGSSAIDTAQAFLTEPKLIWTFYHDLALDFYWLELPVAALEFETRALELAKDSAWPYIVVRSYTQLGILYEREHDYQKAIAYGLRALEEGRNIQGEKSRLTIMSHAAMRLGHLYRQSGDFQKALSSYETALQMFRQLDLSVFLYETHKGRFLALAGLGDNAAAAEELTETLLLFEQYRTKIQEERNRNSFFDVGQDIYDLAIDFAFTKLNDPTKAFDYAEQSRARSLLSYMQRSPEVVDTADGPDLENTAVRKPAGTGDFRDRLPEQVQILQYSLSNDKLISWVITRQGIKSSSTALVAADLEQKIGAYVTHIAQGDAIDQTKKDAEELFRTLIRPIEQFLDPNKTLCVVADKGLFNVPFASLVSEDGKYLIEKYQILLSPSSNIFIACSEVARQREGPSAERVLSVGNPAYSRITFAELSDLPDAEREAREVAACYHSTALVGNSARESRVRTAMRAADVVHLASHFVVDPRSPMLSQLLLANEPNASAKAGSSDGVLHVAEVYRMKLPHTRLVVLSACQTGIERTYQGEGAISVARSFISAGVPLVIASLSPVESHVTAELMIKFHRYRTIQRFSSVEALRRAQLEMIHSLDPAQESPNAWAFFELIGGHANF